MIIILLVVILVLLLVVNWIRLLKECYTFNLPGPIPLPLLGNAHMFVVKSSEFLNLVQRLLDKYGDAFRVHFFSTPYVILNHPKYIEPLMTSMDYITKGKSYSFLTCWLGQGLLTSTVFCKNQRIFTEKLRKIADGRSIDMFPLVALAALDNVTESIMGVCVDAQKHSESKYVKSIEELSTIVSMRMQIPILGEDIIFNLLPYKTRQDKALQILHDQTYKVIKARSEELNKSNITSLNESNDVGIKNKHAFLDLLLLAEQDGTKIDAESIREEVDTFMFEGHDTTTSGIVYSLHCLSKRRDVQEKIYEELKTIFGENMNRDPTYQNAGRLLTQWAYQIKIWKKFHVKDAMDKGRWIQRAHFSELHQMKYLELVLKESMRLFPPVPLIQRMIVKDSEIGDLKLIKGTSIVIDIFHMQRNPALYDDPLEFRPERFEKPLQNPFNWLAFSAGPRNCIGQKFAMMELKVAISEIVKNFVILPSEIEPVLCADLILRSKSGVHVKLVQRH